MGFTTQIFLFVFFPVCVVAYTVADILDRKGIAVVRKLRVKDWILIGCSLVFYAWACFDNVFKLLIYILLVYGAGRLIRRTRRDGWFFKLYRDENTENTKKIYIAATVLTAVLIGTVGVLVGYKYAKFLAEVWNLIAGTSVQAKTVAAPLGISFITFSAISYLVDIYRGHAGAESLTDCMLYLSFFPKVVSGPIVLWKDFRPQIGLRKQSLDRAAEGLNRIMIGFAKKVLLADQFGACLSAMSGSVDAPTAWGAAILYMLQLYYDFAGYSDIAIGLAKLFGFDFQNNFNFPYRSVSIGEFWRRWHISLGAWFREYIYFPLGGSRAGMKRTLRNLAVVFALTGIWHGAGWNYILWGGINGLFVIVERLTKDKALIRKTPNILKWAATMGITMFCWQLFRYQGISDVIRQVRIMFGLLRCESIPYTWRYYFDSQVVFLTAVGILGATVLGNQKIQSVYRKITGTAVGYAIQQIVLLVLFALAILFVVNSTYSPFIYFQY